MKLTKTKIDAQDPVASETYVITVATKKEKKKRKRD